MARRRTWNGEVLASAPVYGAVLLAFGCCEPDPRWIGFIPASRKEKLWKINALTS
jgi:hypothetical protein